LAVTFSGVLKVGSGSIERLENFPSKFIDARNIDACLPDGNAAKRYHVLCMQDGQCVFDATTTWNKQAWQVDVHKLLGIGGTNEVSPTRVARFKCLVCHDV
jgi:hypothetical protein